MRQRWTVGQAQGEMDALSALGRLRCRQCKRPGHARDSCPFCKDCGALKHGKAERCPKRKYTEPVTKAQRRAYEEVRDWYLSKTVGDPSFKGSPPYYSTRVNLGHVVRPKPDVKYIWAQSDAEEPFFDQAVQMLREQGVPIARWAARAD